jgi:glycosyltransferase involved in cell wall biosynthesis
MRITIVQGAFLPVPPLRGGAVEKVWFALGKEFARLGHDVTHVSRRFAGLPDEDVIENVRHIRVPGFDAPRSLVRLKFLDLLYSRRVRCILPAADVLVTNTFWLPFLIRSEKHGKLYVHVQRYPRWQMRFYTHAARLQTVSSHIQEAIIARVPGSAHIVKCIPNPLPDALPELSAGGSREREKQLLFVGRVHPEKGIELLLKAIGRISSAAFDGWKLLVVGPWEESAGGGGKKFFETLQAMSGEFAERIEWAGPIFDSAELSKFHQKASLFIYPSLAELGEASPVAPLEAMANGCPPLVSDLACFRDFISPDVNGFVFDHRASDPAQELARRLEGLMGDPQRLADAGKAATTKAREFSVGRIATLYLDDFESLVRKPGPAVSAPVVHRLKSESPMKITIAQGAFFPVPPLRGGAVEKIWFALGKEFARLGHDVTHVSRRFAGLPDEGVIDNVRHIRVRGFDTPRSLVWLKFLDLLYSLRVRRMLPAADILVTNTFWLPFLIRSHRFGKLYVHVARYPRGQMRFYRHAARVQAVSEALKAAIVAEVPDCADRVRCISNPLSDAPPPGARTDAHPRGKRLLYAGRVHPEKGIHLLVEAMRILAGTIPQEWKLVIVGPWEAKGGGGGKSYLEELKRIAQPVAERVEFTGPVFDSGQLAGFYQMASLFVYPSLAERGETFGVAPLEAMSHGCPALVSDLACFRDFIEDEGNGFVFDHRAPQPAEVLAAKIRDLIQAPARLHRAAENAVLTAQRFSVGRIAGIYLDDFQSLLAPPEARKP